MKDRYWEDRNGVIHFVPFTIGDLYTKCDRRIAWDPGRWSERKTTCLECCARMNEVPPEKPPLEPVAGRWMFKWPLRTTGGTIHGVPVGDTPLTSMSTFCGINVHAKLQKGTGRWTHGNEVMTCLGCVALMGAR